MTPIFVIFGTIVAFGLVAGLFQVADEYTAARRRAARRRTNLARRIATNLARRIANR